MRDRDRKKYKYKSMATTGGYQPEGDIQPSNPPGYRPEPTPNPKRPQPTHDNPLRDTPGSSTHLTTITNVTLMRTLSTIQRYDITPGSNRIHATKSEHGEFVRWDQIAPIIDMLKG